MVSLGDQFVKKKGDERREVVRRAMGSGVKAVKGLWEGEKVVKVDAREDAHAAGIYVPFLNAHLTIVTELCCWIFRVCM